MSRPTAAVASHPILGRSMVLRRFGEDENFFYVTPTRPVRTRPISNNTPSIREPSSFGPSTFALIPPNSGKTW